MPNDFAASVEYYNCILDPKQFKKNAQFVAKVLRKHKVKTVLDVGCGTGIYTIPLSKKFSVEGLDINNEAMKFLRKKGIKTHNKSMVDFSLGKKYDAIICMTSTLLLVNSSSIAKTLKRFRTHLKEGGIVIIELSNLEQEIKENNFTQSHERYQLRDGVLDVIFKDYKRENKWVVEWHGFVQRENSFEEFVEQYEEFIIPIKKIDEMVKKADFTILQTYGKRDGSEPFRKSSEKKVYVLQK